MVKKLMSENNCTYKRALMIYNQSNTQAKRITLSQTNPETNGQQGSFYAYTYRDIVLGENKTNETETEIVINCGNMKSTNHEANKNKKRLNNSKTKDLTTSNIQEIRQDNEIEEDGEKEKEEEDMTESSETSSSGKTKNKTKKGFLARVKMIVLKIKEISVSERSFEEKVCLCIQYVFKEVMSYLSVNFMGGDIINFLFNNNG
ncbi:unnamed protein product [Euphydryas editha]|uniref:Uncharacterized protein n=1 Tax=Euphydryas editha TaxID=104508 RepID=A0AAU9UAT9_EUPED|nr:unnamed protein product [Euphydryas editha]